MLSKLFGGLEPSQQIWGPTSSGVRGCAVWGVFGVKLAGAGCRGFKDVGSG